MFLLKPIEFYKIKRIKVKRMNIALIRQSGRDSRGRIIFFNRGGGHKRFFKKVDFLRILYNVPGCVIKSTYDPNRNSYLALVLYRNGFISYIIAPTLLYKRDIIYSGNKIPYKNGSCMPLYRIPSSFLVHNVELRGREGALFCRAAGTSIQILRKSGQYVLIRLPSKEERIILLKNWAVIGKVSCDLTKLYKKLRAGQTRHKGIKPRVRGVAKNPIDHPHGGGAGRTTAGRPSVSPWGIYTKGIRTTTRFERIGKFQWGFFKRRCSKVW